MSSSIRRISPTRYLSRRGGVLQGCLIAVAIVLVIVIAVGIWVALSWKGWMADGIKAVTAQGIQQSGLPEDQKAQMIKRVNGLAEDFRAGKMEFARFGDIFAEIGKSPLLMLGTVYSANDKLLKPSALPKEEKEAGERSMQRLARGAVEGKISTDALSRVVAPIIDADASNPQNPGGLKSTVTTEELKKFLEMCKKEADDAKIPDEPYVLNVAAELDKLIDKALAKPTAGR